MSSNDEQPAGAGRHAMSGRDRDGERLEALLAEHDAILAQEPARVSARQRLIEIRMSASPSWGNKALPTRLTPGQAGGTFPYVVSSTAAAFSTGR